MRRETNRAAGEPKGARPASGAINRGNAEATPQALACGVVAVCGMLDAAGDATEQQGSPRGQGPPRVQSTAETRRQPRRHRPAGLSLFCSELVAAELCDRAAGEPEGARPASGAINRGNAEATPQASACGVVAVCGMLDAAGSPAAQMKCYIIRSARSGYRKNRPASYRTCGAVLCNVRFRLRAALTSSAT